MISPRPRKPYVQRDRRYVVEFVNEYFPHDRAFFNLRMGPAPLGVVEKYPGIDVDRYARVWKRTCDAVVVTKDEIVLIEGELRRPVEGLGELLVYREHIPGTPELRPHLGKRVRAILVVPIPDPTLDMLVKEHNIEIVIFRPKWVEDYLREVMK